MACNKDPEIVSYDESLFFGEWSDEKSTFYQCSDGTGFSYLKSGDYYSYTWRVSEDKFYFKKAVGREYSYTIIDATSTTNKIQDEGGRVWNAKKISVNGCYMPKGEVMFWVDEDFKFGPISIYHDYVFKGQITKYYPYGAPDCGSSGCVTVRMENGTYNFTASCSSWSWSGEITIKDGNCYKKKLIKE